MWLQIGILAEWLIALRTIVPFSSTVGLPVSGKATTTCKCLWTRVTRLSVCHILLSTFFPGSLSLTVEIYMSMNKSIWSLSLSPRKVATGQWHVVKFIVFIEIIKRKIIIIEITITCNTLWLVVQKCCFWCCSDSPVWYVLIIQSNVESGPKMIQFNIQFKINSEIFIQSKNSFKS